ncbi:ETC complex I subunit conserved region [Aspergillus parasiticus SU-1]|uniref:NADH dehydrogenase [ubiquinone] iron-sulfur protein 4, mitochondrial n=8 Tax=Aspergillus subgen. Circumdati TaxID=2720871 RepID=A0A2G7FFU7_9EURO|nr:ETC complex I subunit conserved region-domain-containing protein [Aspergillus caelatus]KAB8204651.1 ETC complex I subunit conserved region-domain-containing protein [Aspergillus parasiticus]KAE8166379.1 ETC complex I subunit conserved region-domain-containing protein [Aspergillus tamarii]KAE8309319.1 ETC complex I subunit conserved region-domain-containing protein [Aspergillus transmontanensis]KAE8325214.1 ETC complex I subunit conserved region-domain-containing protein [Aspergillus sergii]
MSLFRAGNLACFRAGRLAAPINARFLSTNTGRGDPSVKTSPADAPAVPPKDSSLIRQEGPAEAMARHQPDYEATIDHGTSKFSPVPKRVMDGSEPGDTVPAAVLSGAPTDLQARTVRIYRPSKPATQSGTWHQHHWRMDWDVLQKGHRWENPLMGWQSSADNMQGTHLNFKSKEDAIMFAQKQGYEYFVQEPNERRFVPKAYANNFVHEPKKIKHIRTK